MHSTEEIFREHRRLTDNEVAAAILTLAEAIRFAFHTEHIEHALCMGIRQGLFGADARSDKSIEDLNIGVRVGQE